MFGEETGDESREESAFERFTESLPVRLAGETVGEIDVSEVFRTD